MSGASGKVTSQGAGDRIRQPLPIENLLVWAYATQMVHLAQQEQAVTVSKTGPLATYSSLWSDEGTPVDSSANQGFRASEDAWAIHRAVMKLGRVTLDLGDDLRAARYHALQRGQYTIEPPTGRASTADHSGGPWPTDAKLVIDVRGLVMMHASMATRPDRPEAVKMRFKPGDVVWHPKRRGGVVCKGWYQHVTPVGVLPGHAAEAAAKYEAWLDALRQLRGQVQALRLTMFVCTDPLPPALRRPPKRA